MFKPKKEGKGKVVMKEDEYDEPDEEEEEEDEEYEDEEDDMEEVIKKQKSKLTSKKLREEEQIKSSKPHQISKLELVDIIEGNLNRVIQLLPYLRSN